MASEEEAHLNDYLSVLWKRKAMIVSLVFLSTASAALVSYLTKPTYYEVSRVLKIGRISETGRAVAPGGIAPQERHLIDTRETVIAMITDQRLLGEVRAQITPDVPLDEFAKRITVDRKASPQSQDPSHVRYTVQGETAPQAVAVADAIAESIIQTHAKIFREEMTVRQHYERELKTKIDLLTGEIQGMRKIFDGIRANPRVDAAAVIILQAHVEGRERGLAELNRELRDVRLSNSPLLALSENTRVIAADAMPTKPVKPKTALNITLASALSLFTGAFLAYVFEYWERSRREPRERSRPSVP